MKHACQIYNDTEEGRGKKNKHSSSTTPEATLSMIHTVHDPFEHDQLAETAGAWMDRGVNFDPRERCRTATQCLFSSLRFP